MFDSTGNLGHNPSGLSSHGERDSALKERRRSENQVLRLSLVLAVVQCGAQAADIEADKRIAAGTCAACHGANGATVNETTPISPPSGPQLKAYKDGARKLPGGTSGLVAMDKTTCGTVASSSMRLGLSETGYGFETVVVAAPAAGLPVAVARKPLITLSAIVRDGMPSKGARWAVSS
jgi:hypothetical protein